MPLEQDVLTIGHQLEKLVSEGKSDNETISDLLKRLKELPITLDILQKTRIGMTVNVVRKASNKDDIQTVAKGLIKSWKKLLDTQDKDKEKEKEKPKVNKQTSQEKESKPAPRDSRADSGGSYEVPPPKGNDPIRIQCREMLVKSLKLEGRPEFNPAYIAADIEEATYQMFKDTGSKYKNRIKSRVMNLRDKRNPALKQMVADGDISPERFANMTAEEMATDDLRAEREKMTKQAINEHQLATSAGTSTGQFKCHRCGKRKTSYSQVQTRSADEPMTTFVYCNECGNRWKFC